MKEWVPIVESPRHLWNKCQPWAELSGGKWLNLLVAIVGMTAKRMILGGLQMVRSSRKRLQLSVVDLCKFGA